MRHPRPGTGPGSGAESLLPAGEGVRETGSPSPEVTWRSLSHENQLSQEQWGREGPALGERSLERDPGPQENLLRC